MIAHIKLSKEEASDLLDQVAESTGLPREEWEAMADELVEGHFSSLADENYSEQNAEAPAHA